MVNPVTTTPNSVAYLGSPASMQGLNQTAVDNIPLARKFNENQQEGPSELLVMAGGAGLAKATGTLLHGLCEPEGPIVSLAKTISDKTVGFDKWFTNLNLGNKIGSILNPIKSKIFTSANIDTFNKGYKANSGLIGTTKAAMEAAKTSLDDAMKIADVAKQAKKVAKATAKFDTAEAIYKSTAGSVAKLNQMGVVGRLFGKTALFLRKHLNGGYGLMNGVFAAMTINSVLKAKEGEKLSTFMQDFLGSWIGSFGGFTLFGKVLEGLNQFVNPATNAVTAKGVLPTIAKIVNKIPLKSIVFPLIGSIILSTALQKVSHFFFGKPTEKDPAENNAENNKEAANKTETMNDFFKQTGWDQSAFNQVKTNQANVAPKVDQKQAKVTEKTDSTSYQGYMPQTDIPVEVTGAYEDPTKALYSSVDKTIADMSKDLKRYGINV
ncbi:MAG: hypothetical protein AB7V50_07980 [Vampirovibrionia bacterium]